VVATSLGVRLLNVKVHLVKLQRIHSKPLSYMSIKTFEFYLLLVLLSKKIRSIREIYPIIVCSNSDSSSKLSTLK